MSNVSARSEGRKHCKLDVSVSGFRNSSKGEVVGGPKKERWSRKRSKNLVMCNEVWLSGEISMTIEDGKVCGE